MKNSNSSNSKRGRNSNVGETYRTRQAGRNSNRRRRSNSGASTAIVAAKGLLARWDGTQGGSEQSDRVYRCSGRIIWGAEHVLEGSLGSGLPACLPPAYIGGRTAG